MNFFIMDIVMINISIILLVVILKLDTNKNNCLEFNENLPMI